MGATADPLHPMANIAKAYVEKYTTGEKDVNVDPRNRNWWRIGTMLSFFGGYFTFLYYMWSAAASVKGDDHQISHVFNYWLPIYVLVFFGCGFMVTVLIFMYTGRWTAPPFYYPVRRFEKGRQVINFHVVPAILWLTLSAVQVFLTSARGQDDASKIVSYAFNGWSPADPWVYHRALGMVLCVVMVCFSFAALFAGNCLVPLGKYVLYLEMWVWWSIALNFFGGLLFISLRMVEYHKICMVACMVNAGSPGVFRALRTVREIAFGRLWKVGRFSENLAVLDRPDDYKSFKAVESTYVSMQFLCIALFLAFLFYKMAAFNWLTGVLCSVNVAVLLFGIVKRFLPGSDEDFHWTFSLNYNFPVLTPLPPDTDVELPPSNSIS